MRKMIAYMTWPEVKVLTIPAKDPPSTTTRAILRQLFAYSRLRKTFSGNLNVQQKA